MTKVEMFGHNANITTQHIILAVKHSGGRLTVWACCADTGHVHLAFIDLIMHSTEYQSILESNLRQSV